MQKNVASKKKIISISREPQPTIKQVPVGYFRAFTYQPLAFNPQSPNQYFSYQGGKMLQPNSVYNYPKTQPGPSGFSPSFYGPTPLQNVPQPQNTQSVPSAPTPTNAAPTQTSQQQTSSHSGSVNPTASSATSSQSQPTLNDVQPPTTVPAQFTSNPNVINNSPMRQMPSYVPDPVNLQYITNVAPLPLQQIQFVPCMCPVSVSISTGISTPDVIANKRSDDIQISSDYRDTLSIGEQSLPEER